MCVMATPPLQPGSPQERLLAAYQQALGHELPNHLVAIQGMVHLLQTEEANRVSPDGREFLNQLASAARRTHEVVRALAEVGRAIRSAQGAEPIGVFEVAREAGAAVKQLYPDVAIGYDSGDPALRIAVGRPALYQVFVQLLQNAAQAAYENIPLQIQVGGGTQDGKAEFWVTDNGRGLSEVERRRLFEPFAPGPRAGVGKGLGLFLVRQLVDIWGGTIELESTPGQGATVRIRL
jgi:signal transduction histidine kinase